MVGGAPLGEFVRTPVGFEGLEGQACRGRGKQGV